MRIAIVCRGSRSFINPLIKHWESCGHTFCDTMDNADVVWCEWANEQSVHASQLSKKRNVIVRLHGSEYFQNFHEKWNKSNIATVINANPTYTIDNVKQITCSIPIDVDFWKQLIKNQHRHNTLIMAGSFVYSKNHVGLINMLSKYPDYFKEITFVGEVHNIDNAYRYAETKKVLSQINYLVSKYSLNVKIIDRVTPTDLRELYNNHEYVVSNSINEGQHLTLCEGILCGCKPLLYNWLGASNIYSDISTYTNGYDFWELVKNKGSSVNTIDYTSFIQSKFNETKIYKQIDNILYDVARGVNV